MAKKFQPWTSQGAIHFIPAYCVHFLSFVVSAQSLDI